MPRSSLEAAKIGKKRNRHHAQQMMEKLYSNRDDDGDIVIKVEDEEFKLHKIVLAASCPYFETLLFGSFPEANQNYIELKDTPKQPFAAVVQFAYTGRVKPVYLSDDKLISLLKLSHEYQFKELFDFVVMEANMFEMSVAQLIDLGNVAVKLDNKRLEEECLSLLTDHSEYLVSDELLLPLISCDLISKVLKEDFLNVSEVNLFKWMLEWSRDRSAQELNTVKKSLRLNLMTVEEFKNIVEPSGVLNSDDYVAALVANHEERIFQINARKEQQQQAQMNEELNDDWGHDPPGVNEWNEHWG